MYRAIDCSTWDDPWFAELEPAAKLLFLYLITNRRSSTCGAFEITIRAIAFETGMTTDRVAELLPTFGERVRWWPEHQIVWVKNFVKHQVHNEKMRVNARRAIADLPPVVREAIGQAYPDLYCSRDTVSIGYPEGMDIRNSNSTETETGQGSLANANRANGAATDVADPPSGDFGDAIPPKDRDGLAYALVDAFAKATNRKPTQFQGRLRAEAKSALLPFVGEATPDDVARCVAYLRSNPFYQEPGKLTAVKVADVLPQWIADGCPATASQQPARASPPKPAKGQATVTRLMERAARMDEAVNQ